jgi:predicted acylesterase/phospholipase RssA
MFSGGGMKIVSHIGALDELEKRGYLKNVREFMGTSAGAFVALCKVLGYTQKELRKIMVEFDFSHLYNPDLDNLFDITTRFGVDDGSAAVRFLESCLRVKGFSAKCTFSELAAKTGLAFRCFAANLTTMDIHEFSVAKTPNESVITAIRASGSVPFYFTPIRDTITGDILVDGGIVNNVPFKYLTETERIETLVIALRDSAIDTFKGESIAEYCMRIFACYYVTRYREIDVVKEQICYVSCGSLGPFNTSITAESRIAIINAAQKDMADYIDRTLEFIRRPVRRRSY